MRVLVSAHARVPAGTSLFETYKYIGVILVVETDDHTVADADAVFVSELARGFFRELMLGHRLTDGAEPLVVAIEERYLAPSRPAVIAAVRAAVARYREQFLGGGGAARETE